MNDQLEKPIANVKRIIETGVDEIVTKNSEKNFVLEEVQPELFSNIGDEFKTILDGSTFDYKLHVDSLGDLAEEDVKKVDNLNYDLDNKAREMIVCSAFQGVISDILAEFLQIDGNESAKLKLYNKLAAVLDLEIYIYVEVFKLARHIYFDSLSQILKFLFAISTSEIEYFWTYLESREKLIKEKIFDRQTIGDRISVLEICNYLTDKYQFKDSQGKLDSYKKDSFNDRFHFRVRIFVTNLFSFEDNTGLNKHFHIANRVVPHIQPQYRGKSVLVDDLLAVQKVFNDPFYYLKKANFKELKTMTEKITNVFNFITQDEPQPPVDQFAIHPPKPESEQQYLTKKYSDLLYIPETYYISPFPGTKDRKEHTNLQIEDQKFITNQFKSKKAKLQFLLQAHIIVSLFLELGWEDKERFLSGLKAPTNVKHLTDESLSEAFRKSLVKIKVNILNHLKSSMDNQFAYFLQHIIITERIWWGWLIYGKDPKTNEPYFLNKLLTAEEIKEVEDKFKDIFPYKPNKYFNTYVTPQLTRRMRTQRGIAKLHNPHEFSAELAHAKIDQLTDSIQECEDEEMRDLMIEERSILLWKRLRKERSRKWLEFGNALKPDIFEKDKFMTAEEAKLERKRAASEGDGNDLKRIKV